MTGTEKRRTGDSLLDLVGASVLSTAVAFALHKLMPGGALSLSGPALVGVCAGMSFGLAYWLAGLIPSDAGHFRVAPFDLHGLDAEKADDPVDELLLEDCIYAAAPDSRVVRLFAPEAMPTAGQLQARIERHLQNEDGNRATVTPLPVPVPDASDALHEALASLRNSLR